MSFRSVSLLLASFVTTVAASAQCTTKPLVPYAGLPTTAVVNQPFTYSDGYKTTVNFVYPTGAVPACGWPLVVHVHGLGLWRITDRGLARRGYAVVSYDVRGQGTARSLNPKTKGLTLYGATEKYDLAEIIAFARQKWSAIVKQSKLGVTGFSQGGLHSWFAAAYSGRKITIAGRGTITFPKVDAVVPQIFVPDVLLNTHRNGATQWSMTYLGIVQSLFKPAIIEASHLADFRSFFLKQDPVGHYNKLVAEGDRAILGYLRQSTVPILFSQAYYDGMNNPRELARVVPTLTSKHVHGLISTGGHGSASNRYENKLREDERNAWFDRFLWGVPNGAEHVKRWDFAMPPPSAAGYGAATSLWGRRDESQPTARDAIADQFWLTASGTLATTAPSGGAPTSIVHKVASTYTPTLFLNNQSQRSLANVLKAMPMSERVFRLPALTRTTELAGQPRLSLALRPNAARFVISGLLRARIPGESEPFMLTHWGEGVLGATPNVARRMQFDMAPTYVQLPKGTVLELVVRNHWVREAPMPDALVAAPYFTDATVLVEHGSGAKASWITIPRRRAPGVDLVAATNEINVRRPVDIVMTVRATAARAGKTAWTLVSFTGKSPGVVLAGDEIPIRFDPLTDLFLTLGNSAALPKFVAKLSASGTAQPTVKFGSMGTIPTSVVGLRLTFATVVLDNVTAFEGTASNPFDVYLK